MKTEQDLIFEAYTSALHEEREIEFETDYEAIGDDGEATVCTLKYKVKVIDGKPVVDPNSFSLDCPMDGNSKLGYNADDDLAMQDHDELLAYAQEDVEYQLQTDEDNEDVASGIVERLEAFMRNNPETEQELTPIIADLLDTVKDLNTICLDDEIDTDELRYSLNKLADTENI